MRSLLAGLGVDASACSFTGGTLAGGGASADVTYAVDVIDPAPSGLRGHRQRRVGLRHRRLEQRQRRHKQTTPLDAAPVLSITKSDIAFATTPGENDVYVIPGAEHGHFEPDCNEHHRHRDRPGRVDLGPRRTPTPGRAVRTVRRPARTCTYADPLHSTPATSSWSTSTIDVVDPVADGLDEIVNTAAVTAEDNLAGRRTAGYATDTNTLTAVPDLIIAKSDGLASVGAGGTVV